MIIVDHLEEIVTEDETTACLKRLYLCFDHVLKKRTDKIIVMQQEKKDWKNTLDKKNGEI